MIDLNQVSEMTKNTLGEALGMKMIKCEKGDVVMTMPVDHRTHQPMGLLHGGASVALAETVASVGGWVLVADEGKVVVGQEINANHLRSMRSGLVRAEGQVIHQGKRSQVWEIKMYNDETNKLVSISRCTLAVVDPNHA